MEDIIKQIIQIDSVVFNTRQNSEEALKLRKEEYEKQIQSYKEETLKKANERAEELYNQILESGFSQNQIAEEKNKKNILFMENQYLQAEKDLLEKVFNELFVVEA